MFYGKKVLVFDGPTSRLDYARAMAQTATLLRETCLRPGPSLVVTHDFELALAACDRVTSEGRKVTAAQYRTSTRVAWRGCAVLRNRSDPCVCKAKDYSPPLLGGWFVFRA